MGAAAGELRYPTTLVDRVTFLLPDTGLGRRADDALDALHRKGFVAGVGLTEQHVPDVYTMAQEPAIVEYCPKDQVARFVPEVVRSWIGKAGGRGYAAIYDVPENGGAPLYDDQIENLSDSAVTPVAYGWSGYKKNKYIAGADITTAYRVGAAGVELAHD